MASLIDTDPFGLYVAPIANAAIRDVRKIPGALFMITVSNPVSVAVLC